MAITKVELANMLLGVESTKKAAAKIKTSAIVGTAHSDSHDGYVLVNLGGDVISVDGKQYVSLATTADVRAGDKVYVLLRGADGTAMGATVIGSAGGGDRTKGDIAAAAAEASTAKADASSAISMVNAVKATADKHEGQINAVKATADKHEGQIDAIQKDIADYKANAEATYATKTDVDEKTGAISKTLSADYRTWKETQNNIADNYVGITKFNDTVSSANAYIAQTYAERTELTEAVNQLSSTMTSSYSAFTDYRETNDAALSKAQSDATNAQSDLDGYRQSNDKAVADAKAAGTTAQDQLGAYKSSNDAAVADAKKAGTDAQADLNSYKGTTDQRLDELKNIADNAIETFYLKGAPTASNPPASAWTTDALKKQHAGDLYMDTDTGYSYRWSGTAWVQVKDSDVTKALKEIESVKTTYATKSELKATDTELSGKVSDALTTAKSYTDGSVSKEATARDAAIKAQADSISLSVSKTYTKSETFSAYQSDADSRIATANSNASTAVSTAKTAASDAATAKTNASTAVSTANAANTKSASAVSTANSAASTANTAKSTADEVKASVDGLEIGGRNLVLFSDFSGFDPHGVFTLDGDVATATSSAVGNTNNWQCSLTRTSTDYITTVRNKRFTFSMDYWVTEAITYGTTKPFIGAQLWVEYTPDGSTTNKYKYFSWYGDDLFPTAVTSGWVRTSITHTFPDATIVASGFSLYFRDCKGTAKFRHPKLELGNKPTDWTPAPEDTDSAVADAKKAGTDAQSSANSAQKAADRALKEIESVKTTYATKSELKATDTELSGKVSDALTTARAYTDSSISTEVTNRDAAIKAQADSISLSVSKTYTKQETFSAYQSDADGRIATANSNASTAVSTAKTAASDAATAKTNASTAVSTANSASTSAANAVKTANTANSNASSAVTTANGAVTTANAASSTANAAKSSAATANNTANAAKTAAGNAQSTADTAKSTADNAAKQANLYSFGNGDAGAVPKWIHLGTLTSGGDASSTTIAVAFGNGFNGSANQNSTLTITIKDGWQSTQSATGACGVTAMRENCDDALVDVLAQSARVYDVWVYAPWAYSLGRYSISGQYAAWQHSGATQKAEPATSATQVKQDVAYRLADATKAQTMATENQSSIKQLSTSITAEVTARTKTDRMVSEVSSRLTQTADGFSASIDRLSDTDRKVNSWFGFGSDPSGNPQLTMGSSTSPVVGVYTNAGLAYKARSGATLLELDGASRSSTMPHVHADDVSIGSWQWVPTQNGTHFTLMWIGG